MPCLLATELANAWSDAVSARASSAPVGTGTPFVTAVWNTYTPSWVELSILAWSFAWFGMFFIAFIKLFPVVAIAEMTELAIHEKDHAHGGAH